MEPRFSLPESLLNAIANYLSKCPFNEVEKMIAGIRMCAQEVKAEEKKDEAEAPVA